MLKFTPQFLLGNPGMPRRYCSYPAEFQWLYVLATGGTLLIGAASLLALGNLLAALRFGPKVGQNPWDSRSFEWLTASPPPKHNFPEPPVFDREPYEYELSEEESHVRAFPG